MIADRLLALLLLASLPSLAQIAAPAVQQVASRATATTAPAVKVAEKPIPPFTVWQLRPGESTESQVSAYQLNPSGYWLMLYVDSKSKTSLDLLSQVQTLAQTQEVDRSGTLIQPAPSANRAQSLSQYKLDATHMVIVVAHATGAELSQFELNYPGLSPAAWAHDSDGAAAKLLSIRGTPHLFGMREGSERWQLPDTLRAQDLEPVMTTWMALNRLPPNKFTRTKAKRPATLANASATTGTTSSTSQAPAK